jgi:hypothetical protein
MVINPPSGGNTLAAYQSASKNTNMSISPAVVQGGVVLPNKKEGSETGSASGSGSSSPTAAQSSKPTGDAPLGRKVEWAFIGVALVATGWAWTMM